MFGKRKDKLQRKPGLHVLVILDHTGHTEVTYDPTDPVAVQEVRDQFDAIMEAQRPLVYTMVNGEQGSVITEFDPSAEEIYMSPQLVGG